MSPWIEPLGNGRSAREISIRGRCGRSPWNVSWIIRSLRGSNIFFITGVDGGSL